LHNEEAEPECEEPFDWTWDDFEPTKELLQQMVYEESMEFHHGEEDDEI
jgi:mitogen-activated protein kinase 1/3